MSFRTQHIIKRKSSSTRILQQYHITHDIVVFVLLSYVWGRAFEWIVGICPLSGSTLHMVGGQSMTRWGECILEMTLFAQVYSSNCIQLWNSRQCEINVPCINNAQYKVFERPRLPGHITPFWSCPTVDVKAIERTGWHFKRSNWGLNTWKAPCNHITTRHVVHIRALIEPDVN